MKECSKWFLLKISIKNNLSREKSKYAQRYKFPAVEHHFVTYFVIHMFCYLRYLWHKYLTLQHPPFHDSHCFVIHIISWYKYSALQHPPFMIHIILWHKSSTSNIPFHDSYYFVTHIISWHEYSTEHPPFHYSHYFITHIIS